MSKTPTGKGLVDHAKKFVADQVADKTGEEDFMPFMLLNCNVGHIYAGLLMPQTDSEKDKLAESMMALVAVHRPSEVMFVSTAWMVIRNSEAELDKSLPVRKQADRVEAVYMVHHTDSTDKSGTHSARVIRDGGTVRLSEWTDNPETTVKGRFGEAIQLGMFIAEQLPEDMCRWLDDEIEAGRASEAGRRVMRAMSAARKAASRN